MNAADRLGLPTVEELIAAAKTGHLDDRVERYLPDSLYVAPTTAEASEAKGAPSAKSTDHVVPKSVNGRQSKHVPTARPVAAKAAQVAHGRSGHK